MTTSSNSTCITRSVRAVAIATAAIVWLAGGAVYAHGGAAGQPAGDAASSTPAAASETLTLEPSTIPQGSHPPIRVTFPRNTSGAPRDLATVSITIADPKQPAKLLGTPIDANTVVIDPPALDMSGNADVRATLNGREIGRGKLRYGAGPAGDGFLGRSNVGLLFVYVAILVAFVFFTVWEDIRRGYNSLSDARRQLMEKIAPGALTDGQLTTLTAQLQQAPPGIEGLARTTIAFTLLLIIGIAVIHIIVASQIGACGGCATIPPVVERILTLLAGALTSITGFYFGSRAVQAGASEAAKPPAAPHTPGEGGGSPTVTPPQAKAGATVVITGSGFGQEVGTVTFGSIPADPKGMTWNDTRISVVVPADARPGPAPITITRNDRHQIALASTAFTVLAP
jgi:hypothetical protein